MPPDSIDPPPHPEPPADLAGRSLPLRMIGGTSWARVHRLAFDPIFFGRRMMYRFDAPAGEYGVLYLGESVECALVEVFGAVEDPLPLSRSEVGEYGAAIVQLNAPLSVVDLMGDGLQQIRAEARVCNGRDYIVAQRWSRALHDHPQQPGGICYRARKNPSLLCIALFERAEEAVQVVETHRFDRDDEFANLVLPVVEKYGWALST